MAPHCLPPHSTCVFPPLRRIDLLTPCWAPNIRNWCRCCRAELGRGRWCAQGATPRCAQVWMGLPRWPVGAGPWCPYSASLPPVPFLASQLIPLTQPRFSSTIAGCAALYDYNPHTRARRDAFVAQFAFAPQTAARKCPCRPQSAHPAAARAQPITTLTRGLHPLLQEWTLD